MYSYIKNCPSEAVKNITKYYVFSHLDFTIGFGISPNHARSSRTIPPVGNFTRPWRLYLYYMEDIEIFQEINYFLLSSCDISLRIFFSKSFSLIKLWFEFRIFWLIFFLGIFSPHNILWGKNKSILAYWLFLYLRNDILFALKKLLFCEHRLFLQIFSHILPLIFLNHLP